MIKIYKKISVNSQMAFFIAMILSVSSCQKSNNISNTDYSHGANKHEKECPAKKMGQMTKEFLNGKDISKGEFSEVVAQNIKGYFNGELAYNGIDEFYMHLSKMKDRIKSVKITIREHAKQKNKVAFIAEMKAESNTGKDKTMYISQIMTISNDKVSNVEAVAGISHKEWKKACDCKKNSKQHNNKNDE